jgi:hypothetical protein
VWHDSWSGERKTLLHPLALGQAGAADYGVLMEGEGVFLTIAEVSVAFAGFSGVVGIFRRRSVGEWQSGDIVRFWQMLEVSLSALIFSFLPFVFHHVGLSAAYTWAVCSCLLAFGSSVQMGRAALRTWKAAKTDDTVSLSYMVLFLFIGVIVALLQVANAMGIIFNRTVGPYLFGVFWQLSLACILFWRLLKFSDIPYVYRKRTP